MLKPISLLLAAVGCASFKFVVTGVGLSLIIGEPT